MSVIPLLAQDVTYLAEAYLLAGRHDDELGSPAASTVNAYSNLMPGVIFAQRT
jgi:hypothetical protein